MEQRCSLHRQQTAYNQCKVCETYYCQDCLVEGVNYYYCRQPECKAAMEALLHEREIFCPGCSRIRGVIPATVDGYLLICESCRTEYPSPEFSFRQKESSSQLRETLRIALVKNAIKPPDTLEIGHDDQVFLRLIPNGRKHWRIQRQFKTEARSQHSARSDITHEEAAAIMAEAFTLDPAWMQRFAWQDPQDREEERPLHTERWSPPPSAWARSIFFYVVWVALLQLVYMLAAWLDL